MRMTFHHACADWSRVHLNKTDKEQSGLQVLLESNYVTGYYVLQAQKIDMVFRGAIFITDYMYHLEEDYCFVKRKYQTWEQCYIMNINSYLISTETLLVPINGRVPPVDKGSNRMYTMIVTGTSNIRDTVLVCQLKISSVMFCRFSALPNSAKFCRILPKLRISASSRPIGASVVLYINDIHTHTMTYTMVNRKLIRHE